MLTYITYVPSGFGSGVAQSAVFVAVQAAVDKSHLAPAISMLYLAQGLGGVLGLAGTSAAFQAGLRATLESRLIGLHLDADLRSEVGLYCNTRGRTRCRIETPFMCVLTTTYPSDYRECCCER